MATDLSLDLSALEDLDFPVPCGHSRHGEGSALGHGGDAKFVAVSYHRCSARPMPVPYYYPSCEPWADYVNEATANNETIQCARCGDVAYWADMVQIVSKLT